MDTNSSDSEIENTPPELREQANFLSLNLLPVTSREKYEIVAATLAYSPEIKKIPNGLKGTGVTTRYWDCCKPACAWKENVRTPTPIASCAADGRTVLDPSTQSGCVNGPAYICNNQQPFVVNATLAYGFSDASLNGGFDTNYCCACFLLSFTTQIPNKKMVVQFINSGGDLTHNQFDIGMPGGGVGLFDKGCTNQWNAPADGWGDKYGGVHSREECLALLPKDLQPGCLFRFDFMEGADNPAVEFEQVECPAELVRISGCNLAP